LFYYPYAKQVNYINEYLKTNGVLKELIRKDFEIISENEICKTCDSFQGGEADLVIISLVRNNINNDIYSALGFLIDERRMNVMFSRAKFHLIIVGSIGMFDYWVNSALNHKELPIEAAFIEQLIKLVRNPQYCTFHDASTL
jgi:superfamily I DNA and/or RNA helicase